MAAALPPNVVYNANGTMSFGGGTMPLVFGQLPPVAGADAAALLAETAATDFVDLFHLFNSGIVPICS